MTARFRSKSSTLFSQVHIPSFEKEAKLLKTPPDIEDDACAGDSDSEPREEGTLRLDPLMMGLFWSSPKHHPYKGAIVGF